MRPSVVQKNETVRKCHAPPCVPAAQMYTPTVFGGRHQRHARILRVGGVSLRPSLAVRRSVALAERRGDPLPASDLAPTLVARDERPHTVGGRLLGGELEPPTVPLGAALAGLDPPGSSVLVQQDVAPCEPPPLAVPPELPTFHLLIRTHVRRDPHGNPGGLTERFLDYYQKHCEQCFLKPADRDIAP